MRVLATTAFTLFALTAGSAFACDAHKAAAAKDATTTTANANANAKASPECPHAKGSAECAKAGKSGCPHATVTASTAPGAKLGHDGCPHARAAREAASAAVLTATTRFAGTGQILCEKCDLKTGEVCRSMFKARGSEKIYGLCDGDLTEQIRKMTQHGELDITVHGRLQTADGDHEIVCIDGFSVGTI